MCVCVCVRVCVCACVCVCVNQVINTMHLWHPAYFVNVVNKLTVKRYGLLQVGKGALSVQFSSFTEWYVGGK